MRFSSHLLKVLVAAAGLWPASPAGAQPAQVPAVGIQGRLQSFAKSSARTVAADAMGLTQSGRQLWALEPSTAADPSKPMLVIVAGLDDQANGAGVVLQLLEWWFSNPAAAPLRQRWQIAALPCARPDSCGEGPTTAPGEALAFPPAGSFFDGKVDPTPQYVWRWVTMQAPTVVVDVRGSALPASWEANTLAMPLVSGAAPAQAGTLAAALETAGKGAAWSAPVPALRLTSSPDLAVEALRRMLGRAASAASPLRTTIVTRAARQPLDVARLLAPKYPAQPIMSYIPALAWSGSLRLAQMTGETRFRDKPLADMAPFLSGKTPAIAEPYLLTSLAGHLAFADLAAIDGNQEAGALARKGADFILPEARNQEAGGRSQTSEEIVRFPRKWTDDMFMATSVLARVGALTTDERYATAAGRLLTTYAADLQRPDGVFIHAKEGPHAWGRGNGFAAFGLMEALTYLPASWADRAAVLASYQKLMKGLSAQQAPDGMWRQVVDEPGSYREFTVTAMVLTALARGVRLGWLEPGEFRPVADRAWRGLLAHIAEDGTLLDVCTGTGSGPTKDYYLTRAGLAGPDDRGGAMGITAAIEMDLLRGRSR